MFHLRIGAVVGTAFALDVDGKQYLVTARHLAEMLGPQSPLKLFHERIWKPLRSDVAGHGKGEIDISVLATDQLLASPELTLPADHQFIYGQEVFFLGYPYGWWGDVGDFLRGYPLPFVKRGIVSCIEFGPGKESRVYLDGHNNRGFSGGPVVFPDPANRSILKVGAVISGYRYTEEIVYGGGQAVGTYQYNTGLSSRTGSTMPSPLRERTPSALTSARMSSPNHTLQPTGAASSELDAPAAQRGR